MNILCIGDIFGKPGRTAIKELLPVIVARESVDFVIANVENASGGRGVTTKVVDELFKSPIDIMTSGNHVWEYDQIYPYFESHKILRPLNVKEKLPGSGWAILECHNLRICVVSLQGEIFMSGKGAKVVNPFKAMDELLISIGHKVDLTIVDFHAETTSEKRALGWYLDGRIGALLGTHTHVQTADEEIMPAGMAYISDLGMTGPHASVIGLRKNEAIKRFLSGGECKDFEVAKEGVRLEGVILSVDEEQKKVLQIRRIKEPLEQLD